MLAIDNVKASSCIVSVEGRLMDGDRWAEGNIYGIINHFGR